MGNLPAVALGLVLIAWAAWMRMLAGTWLQPSAFFPLWWCFAGITPLVLAPNERVGPGAMLWVIAASVCVSIGATVGNYGFRTRLNPLTSRATDREIVIFSVIVSVSTVLGVVSSLAFVAGSGAAYSDLFDIERLIVLSNQLYTQRFAELAPAPPPLAQAFLPFVYLAPVAGGILFVLRKERTWKAVSLLTFVPSLFVTILQTTKAALLYSLMLWLSGYFATRLRSGKLAVFTKRHIIVAAAVGISMAALFFATSFARLASTDAALLNVVLAKLFSAAFGHMTVFSQWLAEYWSQPADPTLGSLTFAGPLEMFGGSRRIPGLFEQVIDLVIGEMSNIYTAFRPLIQDFTIPGALAVLSLFGFVGGVGFRLVAKGTWSGLPLLLIAYVTTMWTPVTWIWIYNSMTATVVVIAVVVMFVRLWRGRSGSSIESIAVPS